MANSLVCSFDIDFVEEVDSDIVLALVDVVLDYGTAAVEMVVYTGVDSVDDTVVGYYKPVYSNSDIEAVLLELHQNTVLLFDHR